LWLVLWLEEEQQKSKKSYSLLFYTVFLTIRLGFLKQGPHSIRLAQTTAEAV